MKNVIAGTDVAIAEEMYSVTTRFTKQIDEYAKRIDWHDEAIIVALLYKAQILQNFMETKENGYISKNFNEAWDAAEELCNRFEKYVKQIEGAYEETLENGDWWGD